MYFDQFHSRGTHTNDQRSHQRGTTDDRKGVEYVAPKHVSEHQLSDRAFCSGCSNSVRFRLQLSEFQLAEDTLN